MLDAELRALARACALDAADEDSRQKLKRNLMRSGSWLPCVLCGGKGKSWIPGIIGCPGCNNTGQHDIDAALKADWHPMRGDL